MSVASIALALGLPTLASFSFLLRFTKRNPHSAVGWLGALAMAVAMGVGISSLFALGWLLAGGSLGVIYRDVDLALFALLAAVAIVWCSWPPREGIPNEHLNLSRLATAAFFAALAFAAWRFWLQARVWPHGYWDAWEIWNRRARFLVRSGINWRDAFGPGVKGADYPLLLPLAVARLWCYAGETVAAPSLLAGVFTIGTPLVVAGIVSSTAGTLPGVVAGLLLLGSGGFQEWGATQYADVPLSFYLAAGPGILAAGDRMGPRDRVLVLAGLFLGFAGWTKHEGLAAAATALLVHLLWRARSRGSAGRDAVLILTGAVPCAAAWVAQLVAIVPLQVPALTAGQSSSTVASKILSLQRWSTILGFSWGWQLAFPALAVALALLLGARPKALLRSPVIWTGVLQYAVLSLAFVVTTLDLSFHLGTAGERLALQPWPTIVLGLLMSAQPAPEAGAELVVGRAGA